ncbi:MAG TPA: chemotaxis protein CheW [Geomonas sp.]|nr:chemotaxis protein CheW [Geomonas sp.]
MQPHNNSSLAGNAASQYLSFTLGQENYGIDILAVQEIRGYDGVTRIAHTPDYIRGVINLRGVIVPIVDLRLRLAVGEASYHEFTVVIVLNVLGKVIGVVVDGVSDVVALPAGEVQPAPELGSAVDTRCLTGIATVNGQMLILLDLERLLETDELLVAKATRH